MKLLFLLLIFITACGKETVFIDPPPECYEYDKESYFLVGPKKKQKFSTLPAKSTCLLAPDKPQRHAYRVIHSFKIEDLKLGEFIDIDIFQQVTNDTPKPIAVEWYCIQGDFADSIAGYNGFRHLNENVDDYITHHKVVHARCTWEITDLRKKYFNLVFMAYSGEKNQEGDWLGVNGNYNNFVIERGL